MRSENDDEGELRFGDLDLQTAAARGRFVRVIARVLARHALADILSDNRD